MDRNTGRKIESSTATTVIHDSITAEDRPMGEVEPGAPGVIVSYVYPVMIVVALLTCFAFAS